MPAYLSEFDCAVLKEGDEILAFANLWRSAGKNEMSVDLMRYLPHRANYLMDALFARLLLYAKAEGYRWFNLGAAPLAGLADHPLASNWSRVGTLLYRHARGVLPLRGAEGVQAEIRSGVDAAIYRLLRRARHPERADRRDGADLRRAGAAESASVLLSLKSKR